MKGSELIPGKWYKSDIWMKDTAAQLVKLSGDCFYWVHAFMYSEFVIVEESRSWTHQSHSEYTELTTEEVEKFSPSNTFGLTVGDTLPEDVINDWCRHGENYFLTKCSGRWLKQESHFVRDRKILSFHIIEDVVCFKVSDTSTVYLRARGFSAFKTSKEVAYAIGKWYTSPGWSAKSAIKLSSKYQKGEPVYGTEAYIDKEIMFKDTVSTWCKVDELIPIKDDDLLDYLPDDHPDIPATAYTGRYVRIIRDKPVGIGLSTDDYGLLDRMQITRADDATKRKWGWCKEMLKNGDMVLMPKDFAYATPEEVDMNMIMEQARRKFPIGTRFIPIHLHGSTQGCIITTNNFECIGNNVYAKTTKDSYSLLIDDQGSEYWDQHGGNTHSRIVYDNGKWATIVKPDSMFKDCVKGRIYYMIGDRGIHWIIEFDIIRKDGYLLTGHSISLPRPGSIITGSYFSNKTSSWGDSANITLIREASEDEKVHLKRCIEEQRYVDVIKKKTRPTKCAIIAHFPKGCIINNSNLGFHGSNVTIIRDVTDSDINYTSDEFSSGEIIIGHRCFNISSGWTVWKDGQWADIISLKEKEEESVLLKKPIRAKMIEVRRLVK